MGKAAVGTWVGAGRTGRILALSAAVLVVVVITTLATLLFTAAPPVVPASSGGVGENTPAVGVGGEHYGEGWTNYGHNPSVVVGAGGEHYGEGWNNYGR